MKKKMVILMSFSVVALAVMVVIFPYSVKLVMAGGDIPKEIILGIPTALGTIEAGESYKAAVVAVEEINKQGGVKLAGKGVPFKIEALDTRDASPGVPVPEALLGVEKVILEKKAHAIVVGPFRSEAILASMDMVAKHKVPMLATIVGSPAYMAKIGKDPKYKYCFGVAANAIHIGNGMVAGLMQLKEKFGFDKVYILNQDVAWCRAEAEMVGGIIQKKGMKLVGGERFAVGTSQFASALMKVGQSGAQIITAIFDMPESAILLKQINSMKLPVVVFGMIPAMAEPGAWKTFEGQIGGAIQQITELSNMRVKKWPKTLAFHEAYEKRWRGPVLACHGPAPGYEAVYMLKAAIERAGSVDSDTIVTELEKTDYVGLLGRTRFDKNHQIHYGGGDPNEIAILGNIQWSKNGERVVVYPDKLADGDIWLPENLKPVK